MKRGFKFALVVTLALLGIVFHGFRPKKRREYPEDHFV
jgi:cbb3-type cytochrome oxidase subunit 3